MKVSLVLIFVLAQVSASSYSQIAKLTLDMEKVTLSEFFNEIENSSEFRFFYDNEEIDPLTKISVNVKRTSIENVLTDIFTDSDISYEIFDSYIILKKKESINGVIKSFTKLQEITIKGKITDMEGKPLPGVNIVEKGTTNGAISNLEGEYTISVGSPDAILTFSFIGFLTEEIRISGQTTIDITLVEDIMSLDEVVVIGYGTMKKSDLTGAIVSVDFEDQNIAPNTSVLQAVQGKVPGINVGAVSTAGQAPSITIRGRNSLSADTNPLLVVDGVLYSGSILDFNASDIENIDFLKDASAAAVYGSRAANGVMIITTKSGKKGSGKPDFAFNMYTGVQEASHLLDLMNGEQYVQKVLDFREASGQEANPNNVADYLQPNEVDNYLNGQEVDWYDQLLRTAPINNYELSISGSTEKTKYYLSGTYTDQKGIIVGDDFKRTTLRANFSNDITDWLTIGLNSSYSHRDYSGNAVAFGNSILCSPYGTIYKKDNPTEYELFPQTDELIANPLASALNDNLDVDDNLFGVLNVDIKLPVEGLTFKHTYSRSLFFIKQANFQGNTDRRGLEQNGIAIKSNYSRDNWLMNNILDYTKEFNNHKIGATVVYTRDHEEFESVEAAATGFDNQLLGYDALELGTVQTVSSAANDQSNEGFMTRINYGYNRKYLLTGTFRRDGYSGFAENNKYANFYSASLAWVLSEESFFNNVSWLDFLKVRLSYGENGNQGLGSYSSLAVIESTQYVFGDGGSTAIGIQTNSISNPNLKWETTKSTNFGINFNIFGGRLSGDIDVYKSKTNDLLVQRSLLRYTGYSTVWTNLGEIQNKGIEVYLNSVNIEAGDFRWESGFTFSLNRNEISSLYGEDADRDGIEDDDISRGWFIGESLGAIYNWETGEVYQTDDSDIPTGFKPGDFEIIDHDGVEGISDDDRIIYGNENPNYRFGITNNLVYKNFTLTTFINSIQGGNDYWYLGNNRALNPNTYFPGRANMVNIPYWSSSNPSNEYPRIDYSPAYSHRFDQDRSFVRLQDITLAYNLSAMSFVNKLKINKLRVYVSGKNLYTWTDWTGYDPELGTTLGGNPLMRSYIFGVEIGF